MTHQEDDASTLSEDDVLSEDDASTLAGKERSIPGGKLSRKRQRDSQSRSKTLCFILILDEFALGRREEVIANCPVQSRDSEISPLYHYIVDSGPHILGSFHPLYPFFKYNKITGTRKTIT